MKKQVFAIGSVLLLSGILVLSGCDRVERVTNSTPTPTPTSTYTPTPTPTSTSTNTPTSTPTNTLTPSSTPTNTPTPTNTSTSTPTNIPTSTSTPTSTPTLIPLDCLNVTFLADVTIPDNHHLEKGQNFTKTWRVRNSGTCPWPEDTELVFVGGTQMSAPNSVLVGALAAGQTTEISVEMTAPNTNNSFEGKWRLATRGKNFGTWLSIVIRVGKQPTPIPTSPPPDRIILEAESGTGPGVIHDRSEAFSKLTVWLHAGESLTLRFNFRSSAQYKIAVRYSNDNFGDLETVYVSLDGTAIGQFQPQDTGDWGEGWNVFNTANNIGIVTLSPGSHSLTFQVAGGDGEGVEIDAIVLERVG